MPDEHTERESRYSAFQNSRREFVAGSAGAFGGLAVGGALVGPALATDDEDEESDSGDEEGNGDHDGPPEMVESQFEDDIAILNYARTLEFLEARFYKQGLDNLGKDGLCSCDTLQEGCYLRERAFEDLRTVQEHEEIHAQTLGAVIEDLGGEPIEEPEFDFGNAVEYPMVFVGTAAQLEDVGVSAYAGAAPMIENEQLVPPALGIHSTEARHASYLRTLAGEIGFPEPFDAPRTKSEVLQIASDFIVEDSAGMTEDE